MGKVTFDKVFTADDGTLESAAALAAQHFHGTVLEKWRSVRLKLVAEAKARAEAQRQQAAAYASQSLPVVVPFSGIYQWNGIRAKLLAVGGRDRRRYLDHRRQRRGDQACLRQLFAGPPEFARPKPHEARPDERDMGPAAIVGLPAQPTTFFDEPSNLITIGRILLVPLTIWLIVSGEFLLAFVVFIIAGLSDAIDGFLARRLMMHTELGRILDPLADKLLLDSIYVTLGFLKFMPAWLVIWLPPAMS